MNDLILHLIRIMSTPHFTSIKKFEKLRYYVNTHFQIFVDEVKKKKNVDIW